MGPLPGNWLAACIADLTPDLQVSLSWGSIAESFQPLRSLSVCCFQLILGLLGPCFPLTCMAKAVLTAPLERSTCPYQRSLLSFSMRSGLQWRAVQVAQWTVWWQYLVVQHCRSVWPLLCHFAADAGNLWFSKDNPTGRSERKKKKRQTEEEVGRQNQRVDRNGLCQLN